MVLRRRASRARAPLKFSLTIVHVQLSQNGPYTTGREPDHQVHRKSQTNCPLFTTFPKRLYTIGGEPGHQVCQKSQTKPLMPSVVNSRRVRTRLPHGRVLYSVLAGWCN